MTGAPPHGKRPASPTRAPCPPPLGCPHSAALLPHLGLPCLLADGAGPAQPVRHAVAAEVRGDVVQAPHALTRLPDSAKQGGGQQGGQVSLVGGGQVHIFYESRN